MRSSQGAMLDVLERRVTRSLSKELQARAQSSFLRNTHDVPSGYAGHPQHQGNPHLQHMSHSQGQGDGHGHPHQSPIVDHVQSLVANGLTGATYLRNTSEEMFLSSFMSSSMVPGPLLEASAFMDLPSNSNLQQQQRGNSEELFHSWITNNNETSNQIQNGVAYTGPSSAGNRSRQNSRRMSSELQAILQAQKNEVQSQWGSRTENSEQASYFQTNSYLANDLINGDYKAQRGQHLPNEKVGHGSIESQSPLGPLDNIRSWFNSNTPMTRSRSSELQRKYAQLEGLPFPPPPDALQKLAMNGTLEGLVSPSVGAFARGIGSSEVPPNIPDSKPMCSQVPLAPVSCSGSLHQQQHIQRQMQPHMEPQGNHSVVSDVVGLLKGSLERKKLQTKQQQNQPQQEVRNMHSTLQFSDGIGRQDESHSRSPPDHMQQTSLQLTQLQQTTAPRAQSPTGSSGGGTSHSAGRATSDGPSNSGMAVHLHSLKRGNGVSVDQPSPKQAYSGIDRFGTHSNGDIHETSTSKTDVLKKSDHLARAGSITSSPRPDFQLNDLDGATKKRRVERQRKMAEAKGRGNAPSLPPDLQTVMKRCEALEKEVRSLKLNLSFMNRKDSEQTKRIEELEQQNDELKEEKDRLLEELESIRHD